MTRAECARRLSGAFGPDACATVEDTCHLLRSLAVRMDDGERFASAGKVMLSFLRFADEIEVFCADILVTCAYECPTVDGTTNWEGEPLRNFQRVRYLPWLEALRGLPVERAEAIRDFFDWLAAEKVGDEDDEDLRLCRWFWTRWATAQRVAV